MKVSNCCGGDGKTPLTVIHKNDSTCEDFELCPKCGEHCEYVEEYETQKTALMELIEFIEGVPFNLPEGEIVAKATELLQKERQQIIDAYDAGEFDQFDGETRMHAGKNDYYNKTFNQ